MNSVQSAGTASRASSPVDEALLEVCKASSRNDELLEVLESRMIPVLSPAPGLADAPRDGEPSTCSLVLRIRDIAQAIHDRNARISTLLERLEL